MACSTPREVASARALSLASRSWCSSMACCASARVRAFASSDRRVLGSIVHSHETLQAFQRPLPRPRRAGDGERAEQAALHVVIGAERSEHASRLRVGVRLRHHELRLCLTQRIGLGFSSGAHNETSRAPTALPLSRNETPTESASRGIHPTTSRSHRGEPSRCRSALREGQRRAEAPVRGLKRSRA